MKIISIEKTVGSNTARDFRDFSTQLLATQIEKRRTISFYDACY